MGQGNISTGVKITVDSSELTTKFNKSIEQLNAGLSKAQKALKLTYNESGFLTDSLGRCVEGLTQSQIKLGMWVDEQARVRTLTGGFAEGLSRIELELGRYADELGNVRDRNGDIIRSLKEVAEEQEDLATKSLQVRETLSECAAGAGDLAGKLSKLAALFPPRAFSQKKAPALCNPG